MWERGFWQFVVTSCQKISYHLKNDVSSHAKILGRENNRVQTELRIKIGTNIIGEQNLYKWNWSTNCLGFRELKCNIMGPYHQELKRKFANKFI